MTGSLALVRAPSGHGWVLDSPTGRIPVGDLRDVVAAGHAAYEIIEAAETPAFATAARVLLNQLDGDDSFDHVGTTTGGSSIWRHTSGGAVVVPTEWTLDGPGELAVARRRVGELRRQQ